jgi:hypothetical protein
MRPGGSGTKNCSRKDKFWRVAARSGGKKAPALIAVAHTLLVLIYQVLETHQPFQCRKVPLPGEPQKRRMIRHHIRRLGKLGVAVTGARTPFVPAQNDVKAQGAD